MRQAELWKESFAQVRETCAASIDASGQAVQTAVAQSLGLYAEQLEKRQRADSAQAEAQMTQWRALIQEQAGLLQQHQSDIERHWERVAEGLSSAGRWQDNQPRILRALRDLADAVQARNAIDDQRAARGARAA